MLKSAAKPIGHINVWVKLTRKPSSGNPNAGFDVAGAGNVLRWFSGAPVPDPTPSDYKKHLVVGDGIEV